MTIEGKEYRERLIGFIDRVVRQVGYTAGPNGRNVIYTGSDGRGVVSKDGVSVARAIEAMDGFERTVLRIFREGCEKTLEECGDGTTATVVMAGSLMRNLGELIEEMKASGEEVDLIGIGRQMRSCVEWMCGKIDEVKEDFDGHERDVLMISGNGDEEIVDLVMTAKEGCSGGKVMIDSWRGGFSKVEKKMGYCHNVGYLTGFFVNSGDERLVKFEGDVRVVVWKGKAGRSKEIEEMLVQCKRGGYKLLFVCDEMESEALNLFVRNRIENGMELCVVRTEGMGDENELYREALAAYCGAVEFNNDKKEGNVGVVDRVIVSKDDCLFFRGDKTGEHVRMLSVLGRRLKAAETDGEAQMVRKVLERLSSGMSRIIVGGVSDTDVKERMMRVDDAVSAYEISRRGGVVPGGGVMYAKLLGWLVDERDDMGSEVVRRSLLSPMRALFGDSASFCEEEVLRHIEKRGMWSGYDLRKGVMLDDVREAGILDPAEVCKSVMRNAVNVSVLLMTSECVIVRENLLNERY